MVHVRVFIVSIGAFEKGPIAPEMRPMTMCWYEGSSTRSGCILCANFLISWYAVKLAPESFSFKVSLLASDVNQRRFRTRLGSSLVSVQSAKRRGIVRKHPLHGQWYIPHGLHCGIEGLPAGRPMSVAVPADESSLPPSASPLRRPQSLRHQGQLRKNPVKKMSRDNLTLSDE